MKTLRKIIEIDEELCDGCGQCVPSCAEGALKIVDGKARVIADNLCDGLGACMGECPTGALKIIERKADEFDEEAVEQRLSELEKEAPDESETLPCGCPSTQIESLQPMTSMPGPGPETAGAESALSNWPVKIKLMPINAPFLKGADLLIMADCVPTAYPTIHKDFLKNRVVLIGCPKFDDVEEYVDKFSEIFKIANIKSVMTIVMEVPCCSGLPIIIRKGMEKAGVRTPMETVVISARGKILDTNSL